MPGCQNFRVIEASLKKDGEIWPKENVDLSGRHQYYGEQGLGSLTIAPISRGRRTIPWSGSPFETLVGSS